MTLTLILFPFSPLATRAGVRKKPVRQSQYREESSNQESITNGLNSRLLTHDEKQQLL